MLPDQRIVVVNSDWRYPERDANRVQPPEPFTAVLATMLTVKGYGRAILSLDEMEPFPSLRALMCGVLAMMLAHLSPAAGTESPLRAAARSAGARWLLRLEGGISPAARGAAFVFPVELADLRHRRGLHLLEPARHRRPRQTNHRQRSPVCGR
ncbi:MAG: hypothetical protein M3463_09445 [Verrucomicrobiota bacterium]|nr:hypothetical protein [Verrucomicrobiota bacterium]